MKTCLIIVNKAAGGSRKINFEKIEKCLGERYSFKRFTLPDDGEYDASKFEAVAVAGGDGTLANVLKQTFDRNIDVFYFPTGTLNDKAKAERYYHAMTECPSCVDKEVCGKAVVAGFCKRAESGDLSAPNNAAESANGLFTYTLAAGAFTPIGYTAKIAAKQRIGVLAYLFEAIKQYKPHFIDAEITLNKSQNSTQNLSDRYSGKFNLIMFVKSPRCFGFNFNKDFDPENKSGHLIAIRSPKHGGALGYIEMFFPFFRVFFIGLKKEREGKIIFRRVNGAYLRHFNDCDYCEDGEKLTLNKGLYTVQFKKSACGFSVISKF